MMTTPSKVTEQVTVALDYIQGKRRVERVIEAASALLERYSNESDPHRRLEGLFELIRRNFSSEVRIDVGVITLHGKQENRDDKDPDHAYPEYRCHFSGPAEETGFISARYTPHGPLHLTYSEWSTALHLITLIAVVGIGGTIR